MRQCKSKKSLLSWLLAIAVLIGGVASSAVPVFASETSTETETGDNVLDVSSYDYLLVYDDTTGTGYYDYSYRIEMSAPVELFLYKIGSYTFEADGKQYFQLGYFDGTNVVDLTSASDVYSISYLLRTAKHRETNESTSKEYTDTAKNIWSGCSFKVSDKSLLQFDGYVFESKTAALNYYLYGDISGIFMEPYKEQTGYRYQWWIMPDDGVSEYKKRKFIEFASRNILFLYQYGSYGYSSNGKQCYRLGFIDDSGAAQMYDLSDSSKSLSFSNLCYSDQTIDRATYTEVSKTDWVSGAAAVAKVQDTVAIVFSESDYHFNGYVFMSLGSAENYFSNGDTSGLIRPPDSYFYEDSYLPPELSLPDGDVSSGDISSGDSGEIVDSLNQIKNYVAMLNGKVASIYSYLTNKLPSLFSGISDAIGSLGDKITALGKSIVDGIGDKLSELFMPDLDKLDGHLTTTRAKLGFIDDIQEAGEYLFDFLKGLGSGSPPVITVNLGASTKRDIGNQTITIDFAWYEPYKPTVDKLLAGIVYVTFIWNLFKRLPDILNGAGMVSSSATSIDSFTISRTSGKKG